MSAQTPDPILDRVRAGGLLAAGRPVVVLLSGGRDSTCLLDLAVRIAGPEAVRALHVNYGIREAADADERHCAELCARLGTPLEVRRPLRPDSGNLQSWARDQRYGSATQVALAVGADVAAGHTATDQVETILYRLASSPSRRALLGMRRRQGLLVRPLLAFTRAQTASYCERLGLEWREDVTNASDVFARNRVRSGLVPAIEAIHPGAQTNVLALAEILRDEGEVLDALVDSVIEDRGDGLQVVELARLRELPPALTRLVVQRLADRAAGGLAPGAARRAEEIAALREEGTVQLDIGNRVRAVVEYGALRFELGHEVASRPAAVRLEVPGTAIFGELQVTCELGPTVREAGALDRDLLGDELVVRSWREGDRMSPVGLRGSKSLQDLFTARRVPRMRRADVPVVETLDGEIAWVGGVATSERFKVTDSTLQTARLSVRPRETGRAPAPIN